MLNRSDFDELVIVEAQPAVSIYLPTHAAGREIRQDPIRLKNLLSSAEERLAPSLRRPDIRALLGPAEALVGDDDFWRHQEQGLGLYLAPGFNRVHRLPIPVPEASYSADHFYIRPLLPLLEDAGPFWVLTISAKHTRVYRGSRWHFAEVTDISLPQGVGQVRGITNYEETHYAGPVGRRGALAHAQSLGEAPDELRKSELIDFLRRVVAGFESHLKRKPAPVILAAHPEIQGNFREVAGWKEIEPEGISVNPDSCGDDVLHQRAYQVIGSKTGEARNAALDRFNALFHAGKATAKPQEILKAARFARVDRLLLTGDGQLWGKLDRSGEHVARENAIASGIDLLNYAALMTLRHRGSVTLVEQSMLPPPGLFAAILRY